jgi:hypothetical protein
MEDNNFKEIQEETKTKSAVVEVIKSEVADTKLKSIADVKARFNAYEHVYENFVNFIKDQSTQLKDKKFADSTYKELGVARLIAAWLVDTERFLEEQEHVLHGAEKDVRKDFVKETLEALPEDLREEVMERAREKRLEFVAWLEQELRMAFRKARERTET